MRDTPERPERASSLIREPEATDFPVHPPAVSSDTAPASAPRVAPSPSQSAINPEQIESSPRVAPGGEPETGHHIGMCCPDCGIMQADATHDDADTCIRQLRHHVTALDSRLATAEAPWDATEALCRAGDCNCPRNTCVLSLRQDVARLEASRARAEQERARIMHLLDTEHTYSEFTDWRMEHERFRRALRAALRPDETPATPRPASTADLDQRDRALGR
jgi:hypothetical protein